jgi:hypothetical protein
MQGPSWQQFSSQRGSEVAAPHPPPGEVCPRCGQWCHVGLLELAPMCYEELVGQVPHSG